MKKNEFLSKLSVQLYDLASEEREAAIAYYREYIEDAGVENEEKTIEDLGSVEELAKEIRKGIFAKENSHVNDDERRMTPVATTTRQNAKKDTNTVAIILGIILAIVLCPIWIPLVFAALAVLVALAVTVLVVLVAIGVAGIACVIGGIVAIVIGVISIFASPLRGFALLGSSLIAIALGLLFLIFIVWGGTKFFPWMTDGISNLVHKMFGQDK